MLDLDRIDLRLLKILQEDGRITNLKLAEAVALSPTAVLARVQRLTREGFILGYEARLDPQKLSRGFTVFVEVLLDRTTANVFDQFKAAVQVRDEIMECHMVGAASTTCSRPAWPTWPPTASSPAPCCGSCPACARRGPMR